MGMFPVPASKTVTTAGTRVQFTATSKYVSSIYVEALTTNTGKIFVGDSTVSSTVYIACLTAGQGITITPDSPLLRVGGTDGGQLQLSALWLDCSSSGEKALVTYQERLGNL